jgi:glycosyltransferase involved in cell wall biosynthesis
MKLLISVYACAPHRGSEHAVGWNWSTEACRQGHQVWALASVVHRDAIVAACHADPVLRAITWLFPEVRGWKLRPGVEPRWERTYNLLWQLAAYRMARDLVTHINFDVVHHLTWGGVRAPTFLGRLGAPLVLGPLGGGETSPPALRSGLHPKARLTEFIRELSNLTIPVNPIVRSGFARAKVIFVRTPDTARILTASMRAKSIQFTEISLPEHAIGTPRRAMDAAPRILFVARLIYWKGGHIAIRALAELRRSCPDATLTIVGTGPEAGRLQAEMRRLGLRDAITFLPSVPRHEIASIYDRHDIFLFPSLHDSGGTVVLEALSRGLPVICADSGGPRVIVSPQSGIVVPTQGRNTAQLASAMAAEVAALCHDPRRYAELSNGAIARAGQFILRDRISLFYQHVAAACRLRNDEVAATHHMRRRRSMAVTT